MTSITTQHTATHSAHEDSCWWWSAGRPLLLPPLLRLLSQRQVGVPGMWQPPLLTHSVAMAPHARYQVLPSHGPPCFPPRVGTESMTRLTCPPRVRPCLSNSHR